MEEIRGPFVDSFKGLSLLQRGVDNDPSLSPVFHNCAISNDGAVTRRGGTNLVDLVVTLAVSGQVWATTIKTVDGFEYAVIVTQNGIDIILATETVNGPVPITSWVKTNVWKNVITDVHFVALSAPYDRLLICTGSHPPVQLSFLERTLSFTCTSTPNQSLTAPYTATDSTLWRNTNAQSVRLVNTTIKQAYVPSTKFVGFTVDMIGAGLALASGDVRTFTIIDVSWQWWAEALTWEGKHFVQNVSRTNVTDLDQNVAVPPNLISDLDPRFGTSSYIGLLALQGNPCTSGFPFPTNFPATENEYGFSAGGRYIPAINKILSHAPFFVTYGAKQAAGGITSISIHRNRELRFNDGLGLTGTNLDVYVNDVASVYSTVCGITPTNSPTIAHSLFNDQYGTGVRVSTSTTLASQLATGIMFIASDAQLAFSAPVQLVNKEAKHVGTNGRTVPAYRLPTGGGVLDGCYIPTYGVSEYWDYNTGIFPTFATLYRDRLIFKNPTSANDQLLVSGTADIAVPGEFYSYYQITDDLAGDVDDPFTLNVTTKSRERITAFIGWQQQLFVFTNISTYSVNGGEVFGPENFAVGLVSSYGAYNNRCVVASNLTVLFMNRYGVFDLLNKSNTTDYGSFERSAPVRPMFETGVGEEFDRLAWMCLSPDSAKLYCAIPTTLDTVTASKMLVLDLAWNAWSTMGGCAPFRTSVAVNILSSTVLYCKTGNRVDSLQLEAKHYLDYYRYVNATISSLNVTMTRPIVPYSILGSQVQLIDPVIPVYKEFQTSALKVNRKYISPGGTLPASLTPRNYMADDPVLVNLLSTPVTGNFPPLVCIEPNQPPIYFEPNTWNSNVININSITNADGGLVPILNGIGLAYPSVYASPVFDLDSLGRLKRLKKLHLLFDNEPKATLKYPSLSVVPRNSAIVSLTSNYEADEVVIDNSLVGGYLELDEQYMDLDQSIRGKQQLSIPLQGYGCDYQFFITSVGADGFKLVSFEFDIQAQNSKRYVRGV